MTHQTLSFEKYWKLFPATLMSVVFELLKMSFWVPKKGQLSFSERRPKVSVGKWTKKP